MAVIILLNLAAGSSTCVRYDQGMTEYIHAIMRYTRIDRTPDGSYIATFPTLAPFRDIDAEGADYDACLDALESSLEGYVLMALRDGLPLTEVDFVAPPSLETQHDSLVMDANR